MLWNIEGFKNVCIYNDGNQLFLDSDIVLLTETFLVNDNDRPTCLDSIYYSFHEFAQKPPRGRPKGGLGILCKPNLNPRVDHKNASYMILQTNILTVILFYFIPDTEIAEILITVNQALGLTVSSKPTILAGDFNSRIDNNLERGRSLNDGLRPLGFVLLNDPNKRTYYSPQGDSTIDLFFLRAPIDVSSTSTTLEIMRNPTRKHQRLLLSIKLQSPDEYEKRLPPLQRKINFESLMNHRNIETISEALIQEDLNNSTLLLTRALVDSTLPKKKPAKGKVWFDFECRNLKSDLMNLLTLRLQNPSQEADLEYWQKRREYKQMLKLKRHQHEEKCLIKSIETAEITPWSLHRKKSSSTSAPIPMNELVAHFEDLVGRHHVDMNRISEDPEEKEKDEWFDTAFSTQEIILAIESSSDRKAAGCDQLYYEHIKISLPIILPFLETIFNMCLDKGQIPNQWKTSIIRILYKGKGMINDPNNYRGIALLSVLLKLLTSVMNRRILPNIKHLLPNVQYGFIPGRSTSQAISSLISDIQSAFRDKHPMYVAFIDFRKAFDCVDCQLLLKKIHNQYNVRGKMFGLVNALLEPNVIKIFDGLRLSEEIEQHVGVLQGDSFSPTCFIMFVGDLADHLEKASSELKRAFYADDLRFNSKTINSTQLGLNTLEKWSNENNIDVNLRKTKVIKFRQGGHLAASDKLTYKGENIEIINEYEYLGVIFQPQLTFTKHISAKKRKAYSAIGCLGHHLQLTSIKTGMKIFRMKIAPIITYALRETAPYLKIASLKEIDRVKTTFIKRLLCIHKSASSTLALKVVSEPTFIEELLNERNPPDFQNQTLQQYRQYRLDRENNFEAEQYVRGLGFVFSVWKKHQQSNRHVITRTTVHGFHHKLCTTKTFHSPTLTCICYLCSSSAADRYHILECCSIRNLSSCVREWDCESHILPR